MLHRLSQRFQIAVALVVAVGLVAVGLAGCAGSGGSYGNFDIVNIAEWSLPNDRKADHHPDSLSQIQIVEKENTVKIESEESYEQLTRTWSASPRRAIGRTQRFRVNNFATLWSLDLSILSLEYEMGISGLTKDRAYQIIEGRKEEYNSFIQIDVYWFGTPESTRLAGPATRAVLIDEDDNEYTATRQDYGPAHDTFTNAGQRLVYRRNTFYFDRERDGGDILANTSEIRLEINEVASTSPYRFNWSWPASPMATSDGG
jgi:hypothetical protein